jgi:hypothetical protein
MVLRGNRVIDWNAIAVISMLFSIEYLPPDCVTLGREDEDESALPSRTIEEGMYATWWERRSRINEPQSWSTSLTDQFSCYLRLLCKDPRDRIYAVLAISGDSEALALVPDYSPSNTVNVLAKQLSTRVLSCAEDLELLTFAVWWRRPDSELPSWCMELDPPHDDDTADRQLFNMYAPHPTQGGADLVRFSECGSLLVVKGRLLDIVSVQDTFPILPSQTSKYDEEESQYVYLSSIIDLVPAELRMEDIASVVRTITVGRPWTPPSGNETEHDETVVYHIWTYLRAWSRILLEDPSDTSSTVSDTSVIASDKPLVSSDASTLAINTLSPTDPPSSPAQLIGPLSTPEIQQRLNLVISALEAFAPRLADPSPHPLEALCEKEEIASNRFEQYTLETRRRVGRTRAGRFYNATQRVEEGDAVVALRGADQLFVVRARGDAYELISDVYVDGLMFGEAYEGLDEDEVDYDIKLC